MLANLNFKMHLELFPKIKIEIQLEFSPITFHILKVKKNSYENNNYSVNYFSHNYILIAFNCTFLKLNKFNWRKLQLYLY